MRLYLKKLDKEKDIIAGNFIKAISSMEIVL